MLYICKYFGASPYHVSEGGIMTTENISPTTLRIETLGTFSVRVGDHILSDSSPRAGQVWKLFKYIITNRTTLIPTDRLIDLLWPEEEIDNPIKALYTLVYRLRSILNEHFDAKQEFIIFQHNSYMWNKNADYWLDAEAFEELVKRAGDSGLDNKDRIELYREAFELYRGDYLAESSSESWALPPTNYYKRLYTSTVIRLSELCAAENDYAGVVRYCEHAIELDPYEESLHIALINALARLGQLSQALAHYDYIRTMLYNELGVQPSESLQKLYAGIHKQFDEDLPADLVTIQESLREVPSENSEAFFCDMDTFRYIYQLEMRTLQRSGLSIFIVLITLLTPEGGMPDERTLASSFAFFKNTVLSGLRRGDVVAQPSKSQLLVLLPVITNESCELVVERLKETFYKTYTGRPVKIRYSYEQMTVDPELN